MEREIIEQLKNRESLEELSQHVVNVWENLDSEFKLNFLFTLRREDMREFANSISKIITLEQNERIQATMVKIFHQLGVDTTGSFFLQCIHSIDSRVRANALETIGNAYSEGYEDVVSSFLDDMDNRVRANAIKILWNSGDLKVRMALRRMITDPDMWMRISGLYVIQTMKLSEFTAEVIRLFYDSIDSVREWAYKVIPSIANKENTELISIKLRDRYSNEENHFLRNEIAAVLIEFPGNEEFLKEVFAREDKSYIKSSILKGFYRNRIVTSFEFCRTFYLKDSSDETVRGELIKLLEICRDPREEVIAFLADRINSDKESPYLKRLSALVLGRISGESDLDKYKMAGNEENREYLEIIYKGLDSRL